MILLIDNYDSFSYNLFQLVGAINSDIKVIRNDAMSVEEISELRPSHIIISPGPGYPKEAGVSISAVKALGSRIPILGVCLGHQSICEAFGMTIAPAKRLMHGKQSVAELDNDCPLFADMKNEIKVARYHSLAAKEKTLTDCLKITARTEDGEIMGVMHKEYPIYGVQFHPESILTPDGRQIIENFLKLS